MQHTGGTACRPGDRGALGPVPPLPAAPEAVPPRSPSPLPPARLPAAPRRLKRLAERAGAPRPLLRRRDCATRDGAGGD